MALRNMLKVNNMATYFMYYNILITIARNFCTYENLPNFIDESFLKKQLVRKGSIAFFYDDVLDTILALPYINISKLDIYNRPVNIEVYGQNGYIKRLNYDEYVIMYDNDDRKSLCYICQQYAVRLANMRRTIDINISQQKTPRMFRTSHEQELTLKNLINNIDKNDDVVLAYDNLDLEQLDVVLSPAPFVSDKIFNEYRNTFNEFLKIVGIVNVDTEKRERLLSSELSFSQTSTQVFINNRMQPRLRAVKEIKEKFGLDIQVKYLGMDTNDNGILFDSVEHIEESTAEGGINETWHTIQ